MAFQVSVTIPSGADFNKTLYLFETDVTIKEQCDYICTLFKLESEMYSFAYEESGHTFYYSEQNRKRLKVGDNVLLVASASVTAQRIKRDLDSSRKKNALDELEKFARCPELIDEFLSIKGAHSLTNAIAGGHFNGVSMNKALRLIETVFEAAIAADSTSFDNADFLKRVCAELTPCPEHLANIGLTLSVLSLLAEFWAVDIFRQVPPLEHIVENLSHAASDVAKNTLRLLHTLLGRLDGSDRAHLVENILDVSEQLSEKLLARYTDGQSGRDTALHQQLSLFQTKLLAARYLRQYDEGRDDAHVLVFHSFLEQILRSQLSRPDPSSERYVEALKRIGGSAEEYEDVLRPGQRFFIKFRQIDGLTLHCVKYFEKHHSTVLYPWLKEINILPSEYICPLLQSSILLIDLIVDILQMRSSDPARKCVSMRMFLTNVRYFLEEFFSIGLKQVLKTWREMRAQSGDIQKVFAIVREQLTRALGNQMTCWSFEQLQAMLHATPYTLIFQKLEVEQASTRDDSKRQEILTEQLSHKIWDLVKESKILKLIEGLEFVRISERGSRIKNKTVIVRLSNDRLQLRVIVDHKTLPIPLSHIKRVDTMKKCQHYRKDDFALTIQVSGNDGRYNNRNSGTSHNNYSNSNSNSNSNNNNSSSNSNNNNNNSSSSSSNDNNNNHNNNSNNNNHNHNHNYNNQNNNNNNPATSSRMSGTVPVATADRENFEDLWDALHALIGRELESESAQSDYRLLMKLELKLASLELEGIELPETPPVIPDDPEDFDYYKVEELTS